MVVDLPSDILPSTNGPGRVVGVGMGKSMAEHRRWYDFGASSLRRGAERS